MTTENKSSDEIAAEKFASISYNNGDKLSKARLSISYVGFLAGCAHKEKELSAKVLYILNDYSTCQAEALCRIRDLFQKEGSSK